MSTGLPVQYLVLLPDFNESWIFSTVSEKKNTLVTIFNKIRPGEPSCPMRTEGTTDITKLIVAFRNFTRALKTVSVRWPKQTRLPKRWTYQIISYQVHKVGFSLYTPWRHTGEVVLNYHAFLTSAPDGGVWSTSCHGRFISGVKSHRYSLNRSGYQVRFGLFGEEINCLPLAGFEPRTATA